MPQAKIKLIGICCNKTLPYGTLRLACFFEVVRQKLRVKDLALGNQEFCPWSECQTYRTTGFWGLFSMNWENYVRVDYGVVNEGNTSHNLNIIKI